MKKLPAQSNNSTNIEKNSINRIPTGKLIVIEGLDGGGKKTQSTFLYNHLLQEGYKTKLISFPIYDTPAGKLIAAYLSGEIGEKHDLPPEIPALFYTLDRYQVKWDLEKLLKEGYIIILDRYSPSNLAFQGAKITSSKKQKQFLHWLEQIESRLPKPDLIFFLNVPLKNIRQWINQRFQRPFELSAIKDIHERDFEYQKRVQQVYLDLAKQHHWQVINYATKTGQIKDREKIHEEIWKKVKSVIGCQ